MTISIGLTTRPASGAIRLRKLVLLLAFLLQAATAILVARAHPSAWVVEKDGTMQSAISFAFHGAPIGSIDRNVLIVFNDFITAGGLTHGSVSKALEQTAYGNIPRGEILPTTTDGVGAGMPMFLGVAFKLFGGRLTSPLYLFLLLTAVSAAAFAARFSDETLFVALPVYLALAIVAVSPVVLEQWVMDGTPTGGNRSLSILGIVPAIHIFFEIIEGGAARRRLDLCLTSIQVILLTVAIMARSSAAYLLGLFLIAVFIRVRATKGDRPQRHLLYRKIAWLTIVGLTSVTLALAAVPSYVASGRSFGNFWHRAFVSFAMHPDWPFGNLRQVYDCTKFIPEGLNRDQWDRNGHCVWWVYADKQGWSAPQVERGVYGGAYEAVARDAWLNVIWNYPRQSLETFFYHKPLRLLQALGEATAIDLRRSPIPICILVLAQAILFLGYVAYGAVRGSGDVTARVVVILLLFALTIPPQFVAWSSLETCLDAIVFMYATFALAAACALQWTISGARRFCVGKSPTPARGAGT